MPHMHIQHCIVQLAAGLHAGCQAGQVQYQTLLGHHVKLSCVFHYRTAENMAAQNKAIVRPLEANSFTGNLLKGHVTQSCL